MPSKSVRRKRQKGGFVPTGKTLRKARERRQMIQGIHQQDIYDASTDDEADDGVQENLESRLQRLGLTNDERPTRRSSTGDNPQYNSGNFRMDHPLGGEQEQRPLTIEEMSEDILNLSPQRRRSTSWGGIKKRKSKRHKKQTKSRRKSKRNKKGRQRKHKKPKRRV